MSIKGNDSNSKGITLKKEELFSQEAYLQVFPQQFLFQALLHLKFQRKNENNQIKMKNYNNIKILMKIAALIII